MSRQIWINGKLLPKEQATVSVYDRGLLYGDGIFEGIRAYNGRVFRMKEHLDRLWDSARAIALEIPISKEEMDKAIYETLKANDLPHGYIRLIVTRGAGSLGLNPFNSSNPQVIIIADTIALYPPELYESGLEIVTASTIRNHPAALNARIKSLNYLNNIMAKVEALNAGCKEALMLNHKGEVSECTGDNIFLIKDGTLFTPPMSAGILGGITRDAVMELAAAAERECQEVTLTRHDVYVADECFLTGTAAEVIPVVKIDGRPLGDGKPGPVTLDIKERFHKLVREG